MLLEAFNAEIRPQNGLDFDPKGWHTYPNGKAQGLAGF